MDRVLAGRYQLLDRIGGHGTVRVYRALDTQTGKPVNVKTMEIESDDDLEALIRFQQEGVVISTLKHPNIWDVHSTFLDGSVSCIVSEAFEGRTLTELLDSAPLPLAQVKRIASQVASALAYVHGRGIFHRDIHPDNILVLDDDRVKVRAMMELGVARILRSGATVNTVSLSRGNLPYYVAPEHIAGQTVDGRVDLYALGAVMYHMVTGRPPFEGADALSVATQHVKRAPVPPSQLNPDLPRDWDALILTALAKDPEQRFQTATLMERAIEALSGAPGQTKSVGVGDATSTRCPRCGHEARGRFCSRCGMKLSVS